jgi:hypothetical protein
MRTQHTQINTRANQGEKRVKSKERKKERKKKKEKKKNEGENILGKMVVASGRFDGSKDSMRGNNAKIVSLRLSSFFNWIFSCLN